MIEAILRVIDRLIQLQQYQSERLKKQFDLVVEPVAADLERIHGDYLRIFLDARALLVGGQATIEQAAGFLEARRVQFEPVRQKLIASAQELQGSKLLSVVKDFSLAVLIYFPVGDLGTGGGGTSASTLIRELRRLVPNPRPLANGLRFEFDWQRLVDGHAATEHLASERPWGDDPVACIDWFVDRQRRRWEQVCKTAAAVQTAVAIAD